MEYFEDAYKDVMDILNGGLYDYYNVAVDEQDNNDMELFSIMHRRWMVYWAAWAISLAFVPPIFIFLRGFIRHIIGLKALIVAVAITLRLWHSYNDGKAQKFFENKLSDEPQFVFNDGVNSFALINVSVGCLYDLVSLLLVHEYYVCVCSMEVRKLELKRYLMYFVATLLGLGILNGLHLLLTRIVFPHLPDPYPKWSLWIVIVHPVHEALTLLSTGVITYYGVHIIHSLLVSRSFRGSSAGNSNSNIHSILIISLTMLSALTRLVLELARIIWSTILYKKMTNCGQNARDVDCLDAFSHGVNMLHVGIIFANLTEILGVLIIGIYKNRKINIKSIE